MDTFLHSFFNREVLVEYFPAIVAGFWTTIGLGLLIVASGLSFGIVLAFIRAHRVKPVSAVIVVFVDIFRAIPPLVLMVLFYFALPLVGLEFSGFVSVWLCLSLVLAAFAEEIYWAGITSVPKGQWEAARSTGLSHVTTLVFVIIPQAVRMTIPPLTNRTITITKNTALASVVAVEEMLNVAQTAQAYSANTSPLTLAALGYLLIFFPLTLFTRWVERRYAWKH
ncbi:MAG: amino acid ABC transporter permease [Arenicellales bacterium]|jgi:polar amino acid transport system permease protein|nr:amino acid ABC transporter permease [Arenicellales bacterium]